MILYLFCIEIRLFQLMLKILRKASKPTGCLVNLNFIILLCLLCYNASFPIVSYFIITA